MNGFKFILLVALLSCYTTAENVTSPSAHIQSQQLMASTQQSLSFSADTPSTQSPHHSPVVSTSPSILPSSSLSSSEETSSHHLQTQRVSSSLTLFTSSTDLPAHTSASVATLSPHTQSVSSLFLTSSILSVSESSQPMTSSMGPVNVSSSAVFMSLSSTQVESTAVSSSTEPSVMSSSPAYFTSHSALVSSSIATSNSSTTPALTGTVMDHTSSVDMSIPATQMAMNSTTSLPMSTPMMSSSAAPTTPQPTTPKPTPAGDVKFSVKDGNNNSCVTISGMVSFDVTYATTEKTNVTASINLTKENVVVTGKCPSPKLDNSTSMISVKWAEFYEMSLEFTFGADGSWYLSEVTFNATTTKNPAFVNATKDNYSASKSLNKSADGNYGASNNHSYLCDPREELALSKDIVVHFEIIQIQPFDLMKGDKFSNADVCGAGNKDSKPNSLVPIIVGCALAGLIVIVLIAYLIGRRKSSRGYQQV